MSKATTESPLGMCFSLVYIMSLKHCLQLQSSGSERHRRDRLTRHTVEFINIAKDDALAWPDKVHREYPSTVNARMESTIRPFVDKSLAVNKTILDVLNDRLGLPQGTLADQHRMEEQSCSEARCIKNPPRPNGISEEKAALGAHTDFGSLVRQSFNAKV